MSIEGLSYRYGGSEPRLTDRLLNRKPDLVPTFAGTWGRLMVLDAEGRTAWSNPMWF